MNFNFSGLTKEVKKNNKQHIKSIVKENEQKLAVIKSQQKANVEVAATSTR